MMLLFSGRLLVSANDAFELLTTGTLWAGPKIGYAVSNPLESARVAAYWRDGPIPDPMPTTATGRALTYLAAFLRGDITDG